MARIYVGGAGGAPSNNVIRSLRESHRRDYLIGATALASDLLLADVDERYLVPPASDARYPEVILGLLRRTRPDFLHVQHDSEVLAISRLRDHVQALGVGLYLPSPETVEACVDKYCSYEVWKRNGVPVPETVLVRRPEDLDEAFGRFGPTVWIRATRGGGGRGALPADRPDLARLWIDRFGGWGTFTAAECLTERSVTWLSIWHEGELVVGQGRRRRRWNFSDRTLSGVTGITGVGETCSDPMVDDLAQRAIVAIDPRPHGIFGVDMTYDAADRLYVTEINIGRFFTTCYFFTRAGLNMPAIYCDIALDRRRPALSRKINPLPPGLVWVRGMDVQPVLTTTDELEALEGQDGWRNRPLAQRP